MRKVFFLFIAFILTASPVFADEVLTDDALNEFAELDEFSDYNDLDDTDDFDDFDAMFEDAPDDVVVEEAPVPTVVQNTAENTSILKLTGSFSGKLGAACVYDESKTDSKFTPGGLIDISNSLSISARPSDVFGIYGSIGAAFSGKFALNVSALYFNSLLFDKIYLSTGKKGISWGNLRIFSNTVMADSENGISCEIRYPWKLGTLTGVILYDYNKYGADASGFTWKNLSFAGAADITILNTNINTFIRKYPESETPTAKLLGGIELKRTFFGFDTYIQGLAHYEKLSHKIIATGGFYKLWDNITPEIGINIEYQYVHGISKESHDHFINAEFGIRKIGSAKNMKIGIKWNHDFIKTNGNVDIAFIISSLIPYADWTNGVKITYGGNLSTPKIEFGSALSFSLSY